MVVGEGVVSWIWDVLSMVAIGEGVISLLWDILLMMVSMTTISGVVALGMFIEVGVGSNGTCDVVICLLIIGVKDIDVICVIVL